MKEVIEQRLERRRKERDDLQKIHQNARQQLAQIEQSLIRTTVAVEELEEILKDEAKEEDDGS